MREITVAHSPDADDIFMYYAVKFGWVNLDNFKFKNIALDIETLNERAIEGVYDISAISFALYPLIVEDYSMLRTAVSFGYGYGPKLIKPKGRKLRRNFKVALSGKYTTNAMLFRLKYPEARVKYYNFLDIERAVLNGEVDAGVLIHESILDYDNSLEVELEIFSIWEDFVKDNLPLPLGGMAIRRSIPLNRAIEFENLLIDAVKVGNQNINLLSKMLLQRDLIRVDSEKLSKYLSMYANSDSIELNSAQLNSLNRLFKLGFDRGIYDREILSRDVLIPSEYRELRES